MKKILALLLFLLILNCNNERVLQLPEVENAEITELLDVSPAYIFYDESQPDSTLFNRKNLISTTNWAVNVDSRLTLRQAVPHIQYLLDKRKKKSMHTNENAKNYFTCNDTSIGNLGFLEFTGVNYYINSTRSDVLARSIKKESTLLIEFDKKNTLKTFDLFAGKIYQLDSDTNENLESIISSDKYSIYGKIILSFHSEMDFQTYISIKSKFSKIISNSNRINFNEFIY